MSKPIQSSSENQPYQYWAFNSYSHQDNAVRGIEANAALAVKFGSTIPSKASY